MNDVEMIKYSISRFDFEEMKPNKRTVIEIKNNGLVVTKRYATGSRKIMSKDEIQISMDSFLDLCNSIEECIKNADSEIYMIDDCDANLTVFHQFNRVEYMSRGLGNDHVRICDIFSQFIKENDINI